MVCSLQRQQRVHVPADILPASLLEGRDEAPVVPFARQEQRATRIERVADQADPQLRKALLEAQGQPVESFPLAVCLVQHPVIFVHLLEGDRHLAPRGQHRGDQRHAAPFAVLPRPLSALVPPGAVDGHQNAVVDPPHVQALLPKHQSLEGRRQQFGCLLGIKPPGPVPEQFSAGRFRPRLRRQTADFPKP